jgi:hypothetical protein
MTEMFVNDIRHGIGGAEVRAAFLKGVVEERGLTAMLVHNPPATSPEARSEPNGSYRDSPHAQPLSASGRSG